MISLLMLHTKTCVFLEVPTGFPNYSATCVATNRSKINNDVIIVIYSRSLLLYRTIYYSGVKIKVCMYVTTQGIVKSILKYC